MNACIFDLDGTLADTLESICYSVGETLKEMGLAQISEDKCRAFIGNGARRLMECALIEAGDASASRLEEGMGIYGRIFDTYCTYHVKPYEGITALLHRLKEDNFRLGVLSNKPHVQTVKVVEAIFGKGLFDCIQGQRQEIRRKPDPEGVFLLLEQMAVSQENCIYIGDSEVDIQTGKNAKVRTVGVSWGFRGRSVLLKAGADCVVDMAEELSAYMDNLRIRKTDGIT